MPKLGLEFTGCGGMVVSPMRMLVTAFGPFDGRSTNASSLALQGLGETLPWIRTRILPVDSVLAPMRMKRAIREVRPDVVLMLGEAAGSKTIRLERTAHNALDFAIPDNAGRQPRDLPVVSKAPDTLHSTLPLDPLLAALEEAGHNATISDNAGRYLCNQVMFLTLHHLGRHAPQCVAGFIHLPFAGDCPTAKAFEALGVVIHELVRKGNSAGQAEGLRAVRSAARGRRR